MKWTGISSFITRPSVRNASSRRGFTLTELAIVVGIGGLITGAIWAAGSQVWENSRQESLKTNLTTIVKNFRAYYANAANVSGSWAITRALVAENIIPGDMTRTNGGCAWPAPQGCADHPWGPLTPNAVTNGSLLLCAWQPGAGGTTNCETATGANVGYFGIELFGVSSASCIKAAMINSGADAPPGLYDVVINKISILGLGKGFPVKASDAETQCNTTNPAIVDFIYKVGTPQL